MRAHSRSRSLGHAGSAATRYQQMLLLFQMPLLRLLQLLQLLLLLLLLQLGLVLVGLCFCVAIAVFGTFGPPTRSLPVFNFACT